MTNARSIGSYRHPLGEFLPLTTTGAAQELFSAYQAAAADAFHHPRCAATRLTKAHSENNEIGKTAW
ncbi:MAG: hypothetical protein HC794_04650 [Nitrospiraceae bacterium]|nr:hypothetical protein [Nitrospiraceae bacterium]